MGAGCLSQVSKYSLAEQYIGGTSVSISQNRFDETLRFHKAIIAQKRIASLYSIMCRSFIELETFLAETGIRYWSGSYTDPEMEAFFTDFRDICSLKALNLLNAHSAYIDQMDQLLREMTNFQPNLVKDFRVQCSQHYDNNTDYKLFSCLRNHSQHHQLPIEAFSMGQTRAWKGGDTSESNISRLSISVDPYIVVDALIKNNNLKQKDRTTLTKIGKSKLDFKSTVRSFVSSFGAIHQWVLMETASIRDEAVGVYKQVYDDVSDEKGSEAKFVSLVKQSDDQSEVWNIKHTTPQNLKNESLRWKGMERVVDGAVTGKVTKSKDTYYGGPSTLWID